MSELGAEDMNWSEPDDDSAMQDAIHRALTRPLVRPLSDKDWICGVCRRVVTRAHFKRHLKKHDREGGARSVVDAAWRDFLTHAEPSP